MCGNCQIVVFRLMTVRNGMYGQAPSHDDRDLADVDFSREGPVTAEVSAACGGPLRSPRPGHNGTA